MSGGWSREVREGWTANHHDHAVPIGPEDGDYQCCMCVWNPCEEVTAHVQAGHDRVRAHWQWLDYKALLAEAEKLGYVQPDPWAEMAR